MGVRIIEESSKRKKAEIRFDYENKPDKEFYLDKVMRSLGIKSNEWKLVKTSLFQHADWEESIYVFTFDKR